MTDQGEPQVKRTRAPGQRSRPASSSRRRSWRRSRAWRACPSAGSPEAAGLPKSSVHALFGSKENLQLATISAARDSFITEVVAPALGSAEPGRERLLGLCEGYLSYVERRVFPGGCFFVAASAEVGAQAGRVHDEVARVQQQWRDLLAAEARTAAEKGELPDGTDAAQLAFELGVILAGTDIVSVLHDDHHAISRARTAIRTRLTG